MNFELCATDFTRTSKLCKFKTDIKLTQKSRDIVLQGRKASRGVVDYYA
jgi:hypothetical protein